MQTGWRETGRRILAALRRYVRLTTRGESAAIVTFARVTAVPLEGARVVVRWRTRGVWRVRLTPGGDFHSPSGELELVLPHEGVSVRIEAWGAYTRLERELSVRPAAVPGTQRRIQAVDRMQALAPVLRASLAAQARQIAEDIARRATLWKPSPLVFAPRVRYAGRRVAVARPWLRTPPAHFMSDAPE